MFRETRKCLFGWITVFSDGQSLTRLEMAADGTTDTTHGDDVSRETWEQINAYCEGSRQSFTIPINPDVSPALGRWLAIMQKIGYGTTITYGGFARMAGSPMASRAAGSACARNPIPLIIPCHRVTRHDGSLGNYGGLREFSPTDARNLGLKDALIAHEARYLG
ncbi:methylated-DNA--[protein]-cysteine S-methyltransferase [Alphaproteobacteria bacterium LSUCC0684]